MKRYGYIRISTREQNPGRQYAALKECDVAREDIYIDRMSGNDFHRPQYRRLLERLGGRPARRPDSVSDALWRKHVG